MTTPEPVAPELAAHFKLLLDVEFFDARTCAKLLDEMRASRGRLATVYGESASGSVDERMRKAARLAPSPETKEFVRRRLLERKASVEEHFRLSLSRCEEPQFLRYGVGDFFVAHQDGNTGLLRSERDGARRVSAVIFLNRQTETPEPGAFCGGALVFHDYGAAHETARLDMSGTPGALVAFRAETTHEVTPVTHGERYSIISWYG
jgi:SM-20-related protein